MESPQGLGAALRKIPADIQLYVEKRLELWALRVSLKVADITSASVSVLAGVVMVLTGLFFLLMGTGFLLNELLDSAWLGFAVQGSGFLILGMLFVSWKNAFWRRSIRSAVFSKVLSMLVPKAGSVKNPQKEAKSGAGQPETKGTA